jgi:hypothetical protein
MNNCIRQTIFSSPISLWDIFIAPTTSSPAPVLRTSLRVCTFRIFIEQRAVIRFLTLKRLRASAIATELKSVYETEALAFSAVKKVRKHFAEERTRALVADNPRCERPLTNGFAEALSFVLKERPYTFHARFSAGSSALQRTCLRIFHDTLGMTKFHLSVLQRVCSLGFRSVITGDEL